jgi:hypothetical protein
VLPSARILFFPYAFGILSVRFLVTASGSTSQYDIRITQYETIPASGSNSNQVNKSIPKYLRYPPQNLCALCGPKISVYSWLEVFPANIEIRD